MSFIKKNKKDVNNKYFAVCGVVEIDQKILLVRHTYGTAEGRILIPGGFVKENELPTKAVEREILEETGVKAVAESVIATQFKSNQWCIVFKMKYCAGVPESDGYENSETLLLTPTEALQRNDLTNMSRKILEAYQNNCSELTKSDYISKSCSEDDYVIFGV